MSFDRQVLCRLARAGMLFLLVALPAQACPEETVDHGKFKLRQLSGRLLPHEGEELLPSDNVHFVVRKPGEEDSAQQVTVSSNGEFTLGLAPGTYEFTIRAEGYLFTLIGVIEINPDASASESLTIRPPWC
jgi:hypothetical protein